MARGIGNRQKRVVIARKILVKPSYPLSPRERDGVKGRKRAKQKLKSRVPDAPSP